VGSLVFLWLSGVDPALGYARDRVVQAFRLASGSMEPRIRRGDHVLVSKSRQFRPGRGEIVLSTFPADPTMAFLKRVVAVPGDTVEIHDKTLFVNRVPQREPYAIRTDATIRRADMTPRDNFGPYVVPEGSFFLLGDNRDNSNDSRHFGPVLKSQIKGRAYKIYWPLDRAGRLR